jgi:hypothetical protein
LAGCFFQNLKSYYWVHNQKNKIMLMHLKVTNFKNIFIIVSLAVCLAFSCKKSADGDSEIKTSTILYEQSNEIFPNPERGFIHHYEVTSEGSSLNPMELSSLRAENVSMILRFYYLEKFKDQPLSATELQLIRADMTALRDAGMKCVLRFAYTDDMAGTDAPLSIIKQHLDQLKPVFEENKDVIAFVQAGFIGAWGEWHSSSNGLATVDNEREVLYKLLSVLPTEIMVQVRTPGAKKAIVGSGAPIYEAIAYTGENRVRIGHHNDCFLAGGTDYGTYENIEADKNYISNEALYVPTGGETCPPTGNFPGCSTAETEMKLLKWTFLNLDWYEPVLDAWRKSGCFENFQRDLGYRLALINAKLPKEANVGTDLLPEIKITNIGYAPLYNYKTTSLVLKNISSGELYTFNLPVDMRTCKPGKELTINNSVKLTGVPAGDYKLFLKLADKSETLKNRKEFSVRLANKNVWVEETGMNDLLHQLKVIAKK